MKLAENRTFHATVESWLGQLILPLVFSGMLLMTVVNFSGWSPWIGAVGLGIMVGFALIEYVLPMVRNWLNLDDRSIEGSLYGRYFHIYWSEVLAAWMFQRKRRRFLCLGTREGTLVIPLRFFDDNAVWNIVREEVPSAALQDDAIQQLPDFQQWETARDNALDQANPRAVADHWIFQVAGWAGLTFLSFGIINAIRDNLVPQVVLFSILAGIIALVLLNWGVTEFTSEAVERHTLFGDWRIGWEDIEAIEIDPFNAVLVLSGEKQQVVIPGPGLWIGVNKKGAIAMLLAQAERRGIPMRRSLGAVLKLPRNSRIRK